MSNEEIKSPSQLIHADSMADVKAAIGDRNKPKLETTITERVIKGPSEENRRLRGLGEQLCPDGYEHLGSIAIHLYKPKFGSGMEVRTQSCIDKETTNTEANLALHTAAIAVAKKFGWQPDRRQRKIIKPE